MQSLSADRAVGGDVHLVGPVDVVGGNVYVHLGIQNTSKLSHILIIVLVFMLTRRKELE